MKPLRIQRRARSRPNTRSSRQSRLPCNSAIHTIGVIGAQMLAGSSDLIGDSEAFNRPMGRMGTPEEIAYGMVFPALDESSYSNGTEMVIDGGRVSGGGGWRTHLRFAGVKLDGRDLEAPA